MNRTVIDIQLRVPGEENKVVIDGLDLTHAKVDYLLLELRGGCPTKYIIGNRKTKTLREKIAMWLMNK